MLGVKLSNLLEATHAENTKSVSCLSVHINGMSLSERRQADFISILTQSFLRT
jgi:hypothetical protein